MPLSVYTRVTFSQSREGGKNQTWSDAKFSRKPLIISMEVSLVALLARLHDEWKEKISADEEAQQVRMEHNFI